MSPMLARSHTHTHTRIYFRPLNKRTTNQKKKHVARTRLQECCERLVVAPPPLTSPNTTRTRSRKIRNSNQQQPQQQRKHPSGNQYSVKYILFPVRACLCVCYRRTFGPIPHTHTHAKNVCHSLRQMGDHERASVPPPRKREERMRKWRERASVDSTQVRNTHERTHTHTRGSRKIARARRSRP